jgi:hypothetical protein
MTLRADTILAIFSTKLRFLRLLWRLWGGVNGIR